MVFHVPVNGIGNDVRAVLAAHPDGPGPALTDMRLVGAEFRARLVTSRRVIDVALDAERAGIASGDDARRVWLDLSNHGLLDWLILHRFKHEEGVGTFLWSPRAHAAGTRYESKVRRGGKPRVWAAILRRLDLMSTLRLAWPAPSRRAPVHGLLTMTSAGSGWRRIEVNAALVAGGRRRYAQVPVALLAMDPACVRLGSSVLAKLHHAQPTGAGSVPVRNIILREETLWRWAGVRSGLGGPRRWPAAHGSVVRHLDRLVDGDVIGRFDVRGPPGPECRFTIEAAPWWLGAHPGPPTVSLLGTPPAGAELRTWRRTRGLTQAQVALAVGASQSKVSAVERADEPLPRAWRRALAGS